MFSCVALSTAVFSSRFSISAVSVLANELDSSIRPYVIARNRSFFNSIIIGDSRASINKRATLLGELIISICICRPTFHIFEKDLKKLRRYQDFEDKHFILRVRAYPCQRFCTHDKFLFFFRTIYNQFLFIRLYG